jgi:5-methylcytosine-specific restriction endonuclease McrA
MGDARLSAQQRREILARACGCCEYCRGQVRFALQPFAVDHVVPWSLGGRTDSENLALTCPGCNGHKYNNMNREGAVNLRRLLRDAGQHPPAMPEG